MGKNILYIAEIVTKAGVYCVKKQLKALKKEFQADFTIANADGASGGFGLGKSHSMYLRKLGVDVLTSGDLIYNKRDMAEHLPQAYHLLRPANFPYSNPGRGWRTYRLSGHPKGGAGAEKPNDTNRKNTIVVISLLGQAGLNSIHPANPYAQLTGIVERAKKDTNIIILDFHALATAEKVAMNLYAAGKVSAVIGSGMRVQTTDARILPQGTAVISDAGRSGSIQSVGGFIPETEIQQRIRGISLRSTESWEGLEVQGLIVRIDDDGQAQSIEPFRRPVDPPEPNQTPS